MISIAITPGLSPESVSIKATGYQDAPVTADILKDVWGIDDLAAVARDFAKANGYHNLTIGGVVWDASTVNGAAQLEPGENGGANFAENIDRCYVRLAPTSAVLTEIQEEVVLADHDIWDNRDNPEERKFKAGMSVTSSTSVESSWEHSQSVGFEADIGTKIGPVEGKTSVSYTDEWGESHGESHGQDVEFSNEIEGDLDPGDLQVAVLVQQRGFAKIQTNFAVAEPGYHYGEIGTYGFLIGFEASGSVKATYEGHPDIGVSRVVIQLAHLLRQAGKPATVHNSRIDTIGVFADADMSSHPIPDTSEESIRKASGVHALTTTYERGKKVRGCSSSR